MVNPITYVKNYFYWCEREYLFTDEEGKDVCVFLDDEGSEWMATNFFGKRVKREILIKE